MCGVRHKPQTRGVDDSLSKHTLAQQLDELRVARLLLVHQAVAHAKVDGDERLLDRGDRYDRYGP